MANKIEKNINIPAWGEWSEGIKEYVPGKPKFIENKKGEDTNIDREKAYNQTEGKSIATNSTQEKKPQLAPHIQEAIKKLDRPEAQQGIAQSYANIDQTIKNSKNEPWIAGFLGKMMNELLS